MKDKSGFLKPSGWLFFNTELERWLAVSVLFGIVLMSIRIIISGDFIFSFLLWNLFLAFIPYVISKWLSQKTSWIQNRLKFCLIFIVWLIFIPNSFYIITDLFHLGNFSNMPLWYDLAMILSFAWNGLLLGILSVRQLEKVMEEFFGKKTEVLFIYPVMFLNALGVYIGRFLRFNSWDIITNPFHLAVDISNLVIHPLNYRYAWSMIACFSVFMTLMYLTIKKISKAIV